MKKRVKIILGIFLFIVFLYFLIDLSLTVLGKGYIIFSNGKAVLLLGASKYWPKNLREPYLPEVKAAFKESQKVKAQDGSGDFIYQEPKYERAMKVNQIIGHTVVGKDIETGEPIKYLWTKNSGYSCEKGDFVQIGDQIIDPSLHPERMKYVFFGNTWRGVLGDEGLSWLGQDLNKGDGAKVYLVSEEKDTEGRSEIMNLMLFTSKENCINTYYQPLDDLKKQINK